MPTLSGRVLGLYHTLSAIRAGATGEVCRAPYAHVDRVLSIKALPARVAQCVDLPEQLQREVHPLLRSLSPYSYFWFLWLQASQRFPRVRTPSLSSPSPASNRELLEATRAHWQRLEPAIFSPPRNSILRVLRERRRPPPAGRKIASRIMGPPAKLLFFRIRMRRVELPR